MRPPRLTTQRIQTPQPRANEDNFSGVGPPQLPTVWDDRQPILWLSEDVVLVRKTGF